MFWLVLSCSRLMANSMEGKARGNHSDVWRPLWLRGVSAGVPPPWYTVLTNPRRFISDDLSEKSTEEMSSSSPCRSTSVLIRLPLSMMSDCWTKKNTHKTHLAELSWASSSVSISLKDKSTSVMIRMDGIVVWWTQGRPIKHLHSAETHPYVNVFLELTSGESRFSFLNWRQAAVVLSVGVHDCHSEEEFTHSWKCKTVWIL